MPNLIPRPIHAVLDYVYALKAFAAPKVMGFEDNKAASTVCYGVGVVALLSAFTTRHEGGVVKMIPFNTHLKLDLAAAGFSLAAPWLFGFAKNGKARNSVIALALLQGVVALLSTPDEE
ncbi:MAG TPA: hypothetical protein VF600_14870 [Abditibacteriaceae bacterium]|jgi:hypothetical protein